MNKGTSVKAKEIVHVIVYAEALGAQEKLEKVKKCLAGCKFPNHFIIFSLIVSDPVLLDEKPTTIVEVKGRGHSGWADGMKELAICVQRAGFFTQLICTSKN